MPVIRPPRFNIKRKSPAAVWLRGFVFCAGPGRRVLLPQRALQHDVAEGQRVVQADFVGLAGNALWQGLALVGGKQHDVDLVGHVDAVFLLGREHLQVDNERVLHRAVVNIVAAAHQRAALIGQFRGISHI